MRIRKLELENFRGFEGLSIDLHPECTVLFGVNGSGKSSILDALAVGIGAWFLGLDTIPPRPIRRNEVRRAQFTHNGQIDLEPQYPVRVEVAADVGGNHTRWERAVRRAGGKTTHGEAHALKEIAQQAQRKVKNGAVVALPVLAYYGTGRLWAQKNTSQRKQLGLSSRMLGYEDCLDPASNHKLFEAWMRQQEQARIQRRARSPEGDTSVEDVHLETVAKTAARCVEGAKEFHFDVASDELRLTFDNGKEQSFELLSDGYRNLVAMAADIAWRAVRLNPHWGPEAPERAEGVVLIDEIELHLHPAWQRTVIPQLRRAFPAIQFVVTTHSPQVLASVHADSVRLLDHRGAVRGVSVALGLDTNTVLRDVMGVAERPDEYKAKLKLVADLIEDHQLQAARKEIDDLAKVLGWDDPTITSLEWELSDAQEHPPADQAS